GLGLTVVASGGMTGETASRPAPAASLCPTAKRTTYRKPPPLAPHVISFGQHLTYRMAVAHVRA
ncbi:hypothetical protein AB0H09_33325, partial [Streptomyces lydicus]|uniref:hypothetical protein n=1 Tax=Streptomyces lydicus TaxID=47763 RepID=UPI0033F70016